MKNSHKTLVRTLKGEKQAGVPFWFMRQAGRYLPEYRELRSQAKDFLDFCYTPAMAVEATLQPIKRFDMSGAIIFSDILVIPQALGVEAWFEEGHGPRLTPVRTEEVLGQLGMGGMEKMLSPVYEALRRTKASLPDGTALIGFAGAPWTIACYVVEGKGGSDFQNVREFAASEPAFFAKLISLLSEAIAVHAIKQIEAGAEVIQIFDSWAGVLDEKEFSRWVIDPTKAIVRAIKAKYPGVPVIGFPRLAGNKYGIYAKETGVDAINIDPSVSLENARKLQDLCIIQGNLDPVLLADDREAMLAEAGRIVSKLGNKAFVFNLGHGILPRTPVENVRALCDFLKEL